MNGNEYNVELFMMIVFTKLIAYLEQLTNIQMNVSEWMHDAKSASTRLLHHALLLFHSKQKHKCWFQVYP